MIIIIVRNAITILVVSIDGFFLALILRENKKNTVIIGMGGVKMIMRIGKLQLRFYASLLEKRVGICSQKDTLEDKHALLWDFDNSPISGIINTLNKLLLRYSLPTIYVIASSPHSYHAYCFTARPFREIIHILSDTPEIDDSYLRLGIVRGYYTLRITPRKNEKFRIVKIIESARENEMEYMELTTNEYLTSNKGKGGKRHAKR